MKSRMQFLAPLILISVLTSTSAVFAAKGIKCRVFQESVGGQNRFANQEQAFTVSKSKKNESAYLKTVVSNLDAELTDTGIKLAVSNGIGKHRKTLQFKKGAKRLSQTFIYPSDNPNITRNKVRVDCLK